jgi:hypothetical protein
VTLTQHAHIYRIPTSNFNFGQFLFLFFFINAAPTDVCSDPTAVAPGTNRALARKKKKGPS